MPLTQNLRKSITLPGRSSESMAKNQSLDSWPFRKLETPNLSRAWNHFQGARHPFSCRAASKCTGFVLSSWPQWLGSFICLFTLIIHKKMPWKVMQTVQEQRCTTLRDWVGLRDCFQYSSAFETAVSMQVPSGREDVLHLSQFFIEIRSPRHAMNALAKSVGKDGVGCQPERMNQSIQMHTKLLSLHQYTVKPLKPLKPFVSFFVHLSNGTQGFSRIKSAELLQRYLHPCAPGKSCHCPHRRKKSVPTWRSSWRPAQVPPSPGQCRRPDLPR